MTCLVLIYFNHKTILCLTVYFIINLVNNIIAPLFNETLVNRKWVAYFIKASCMIFYRYLKINPIMFSNCEFNCTMSLQEIRKKY